MKKRRFTILCCILTPIITLTLFFGIEISRLPSTIFIRDGERLSTSPLFQIRGENESSPVFSKSNQEEKSQKIKLSFLGLMNVKSLNVKSVPDNISVYLGGQPIGVKLNTKGVLVVALSDVDTPNGKVQSPASAAGIEIGDSIIRIKGKAVQSSQDTIDIINKNKGNEIDIEIERNGSLISKKLIPVKSAVDSKYKIGLWVRDSTAGIGTLTFYDDKTNSFAALGHPITDIDTGTILRVSSGNLVNSSIISVRKGEKGNPGELKGIFVDEDRAIGTINKNTQCGIYGTANIKLINKKHTDPVQIALRDEIKLGPAKIITTIDGENPEAYDVEIEKLLEQNEPGPKSMIIRVTDAKLLAKTGGIVQGMSGSPIIQNNKIVGAVTHVLVNKPDTGYGIYIEWMLRDSGLIS